MKLHCLALLSAVLVGACGGASGGDPPLQQTEVFAESLVLGGQATAPLRRPLLYVRSVWGVDAQGARVEFREGLDWLAGRTGIARTPTSRIPDFDAYSVARQADGRFSFSAEPRNPPLLIPFQVYVDYVSTHADATIVPAAGAAPPRKVVCLGDSIAAGAHTLAGYFDGNDSDSYCGLLRAYLGPSAQVANPSVPGGTLRSVLPDLPAILDGRPDLLILGFGMNDHVLHGAPGLPAFESELESAVRAAQAVGSRVILLGFFQQNAAWELEDPAMTLAYNEAIRRVAERSAAAYVDIASVFARSAPPQAMIGYLTGDFLHHPNNYGHRIYFSLLLPHVLDKPARASGLPVYVDPA